MRRFCFFLAFLTSSFSIALLKPLSFHILWNTVIEILFFNVFAWEYDFITSQNFHFSLFTSIILFLHLFFYLILYFSVFLLLSSYFLHILQPFSLRFIRIKFWPHLLNFHSQISPLRIHFLHCSVLLPRTKICFYDFECVFNQLHFHIFIKFGVHVERRRSVNLYEPRFQFWV